jgi:hypothetical protein
MTAISPEEYRKLIGRAATLPTSSEVKRQDKSTAADTGNAQVGVIRVQSETLARALQNDRNAVVSMFRQFVPANEDIEHAEYLGAEGMFGFGLHSFGAVTDRRVASIRVGAFGQVTYHDGFLEYVNSTAIYQPSKLGMFVTSAIVAALLAAAPVVVVKELAASQFIADLSTMQNVLLGILAVLLGLVGAYAGVRLWYRFVKCGLVFWVKEGMPVQLFTNRNRLAIANRLYRTLADLRDDRIENFQHGD